MDSNLSLKYTEIISIIKRLPQSKLRKIKEVIDDRLHTQNPDQVALFKQNLERLHTLKPFEKLSDPVEWQRNQRDEW